MSGARGIVLFASASLAVSALAGCIDMADVAVAKAQPTDQFPAPWGSEAPGGSAEPSPAAAGANVAPSPAPAPAQQGTVVLKNGTRVSGSITANQPGHFVTVVADDGRQRTFDWSNVDEVMVGNPGTTPAH